jgi:hypothetical protein
MDEYPDFPDCRRKIESLFLRHRDVLINQIIDEREVVLSENRNRSSSLSGQSADPNYAEEHAAAIERIEKLQKREIEQLIVAELIRERTMREEIAVREKLEARQRELAEEVRQRQAADCERRNAKREVLLGRQRERERELADLRRQQEEQIEKNRRAIEEMKAKRMKDMAEADIQRQKKAEAQREALDRQLEEEKKAIVAKQKEQAIREREMQMRRIEKLNEMKERNQRIREEQRERFAISQQRVLQQFEERKKAIQLKEVAAKGRYEVIIKNRDDLSRQVRARSQMQLERNQMAKITVEKQREEHIRAIVFKDTKDQERRDAIMAKRIERFAREREIELEKKEHIERQRQSRLEERKKKVELFEKKQEESEKSVEAALKTKADELTKKVAIQKVLDKLRDDAADRMAKQHQAKRKRQGETAAQREARAIVYVEQERELALKKRDAATLLDFKKEATIHEFRELMKRGGNLNIEALAKRFDIDLEYLRHRVEESKRAKTVDSGQSRRTSRSGSPSQESKAGVAEGSEERDEA